MPDISVYREQFPCKPLGPVDRPKPKTDYNPPCSPFQDCSTYRIDYVGCHGKPSTSIEPRSSWIRPVSRFDDRTTYQYDYTRYCAEKYSVVRATRAQEISAVSSPFRECSTYRVYLSIYLRFNVMNHKLRVTELKGGLFVNRRNNGLTTGEAAGSVAEVSGRGG